MKLWPLACLGGFSVVLLSLLSLYLRYILLRYHIYLYQNDLCLGFFFSLGQCCQDNLHLKEEDYQGPLPIQFSCAMTPLPLLPCTNHIMPKDTALKQQKVAGFEFWLNYLAHFLTCKKMWDLFSSFRRSSRCWLLAPYTLAKEIFYFQNKMSTPNAKQKNNQTKMKRPS